MARDSSLIFSSFCSGGECLGVSPETDFVRIRTTEQDSAEVRVSREEWAAFVAGVKNGEFDVD